MVLIFCFLIFFLAISPLMGFYKNKVFLLIAIDTSINNILYLV